jgi:hypothetical protein
VRVEGEGHLATTLPRALIRWFVFIVLFSAIGLLAPLIVPWWHTQHFDASVSFGRGELFGWSLAVFSAALVRSLAHPGKGEAVTYLRFCTALLLACAGGLVGIQWVDLYEDPTMPFLRPENTVVLSTASVLISTVLGMYAEIAFVHGLRTAVREIP